MYPDMYSVFQVQNFTVADSLKIGVVGTLMSNISGDIAMPSTLG